VLTKPHIVSMVMNQVAGDSRVIKTAQAAMNAGYSATIIGVSSSGSTERKDVEGVPVVLLPNYAAHLKRHGMWGEERDLRLLVGGYLRAAIPEIIALRPDLLHSHDMIGLKIGVSAARAMQAAGRNIPWVHDLHEFVAGLRGELAESYMPVCLEWEREFLHKADHLFTVSDALADEIKSRYLLPEAPTVTFNTPNMSAFSDSGPDVRSALGLPKEAPLVVFVGGATPLRGCDTIVEAVASLENVHLAMVSQGKYVNELAAKAAEMGMGERFHVHPYVPSDQVTSFIRTADVGIHGLVHYPNAEVAMPNKMFEYLHAGLPLVVSDVASMRCFVEENGIGRSFQAGDAGSCAEAIRFTLANNTELRRHISSPLKEKYSWEEQERKIQAIYEQLLSKPRTAPSDEDRERAFYYQKIEMIALDATYARALAEVSFRKHSAEVAIIGKTQERLIAEIAAIRKNQERPIAEISAIRKAQKRLLAKLLTGEKAHDGLRAPYLQPKPSLLHKARFVVSVASKQGMWGMFKFVGSRVRRKVSATKYDEIG